MKIRNGFVSNSSSSSFICLGVTDEKLITQLIDAEKLEKDEEGLYPDQGYGMFYGKLISFLNYDGDSIPGLAGISDDKLLKILENNSITEAKIKVCRLIKEQLNVEIKPEELVLEYGESSDPW